MALAHSNGHQRVDETVDDRQQGVEESQRVNNGLGQLPVGPGLTTIVLRTPLGVMIVDPFAPPDPTVDRIVKMLGIEIEVRLGGPTEEDLAAPQLSTGLLMVLGAGAFIGWNIWRNARGRR